MGYKVIYATSAFTGMNAGEPGKQLESREHDTVAAAKKAPLPAGYTFAFIRAEDGDHVYSVAHGWEFFKRQA